jgi:hypothetical protein
MLRLTLILTLALSLSACGKQPGRGALKETDLGSTRDTPSLALDPALAGLAARHANHFPDDSGLWLEPEISSRLKLLLGDKYTTFFGCIDLKSPVGFKDGVLYVTGSNSRDRTYSAVFALQISSGSLFVRLRERGQESDYPYSGPAFKLPRAIEGYMAHWSLWPENQALVAGHPAVTDRSVAQPPPVPATLAAPRAAKRP